MLGYFLIFCLCEVTWLVWHTRDLDLLLYLILVVITFNVINYPSGSQSKLKFNFRCVFKYKHVNKPSVICLLVFIAL